MTTRAQSILGQQKPLIFEEPLVKTPPNNMWRLVKRFGAGWLAALGLALLILSIVFADHITPYHPTANMDLRNKLAPPAWESGGSMDHILGTDKLGRDILTRILHGGRVSLQVAFFASTISTLIGAAYGMISGYSGGTIDRIMVGITDLWIAFPFLVLALAIIAVVGSSSTNLIILLTLAGWVYPAKVTRARTLSLRNMDYVHASMTMGAGRFYILRTHILPSVVGINIVLWTFAVGTLVLIEGSLSFIGLGVSPPNPSWGNMLSDGQQYLQDAWWLSVFPGLALVFTVLCVNTIGDALQKMSYDK